MSIRAGAAAETIFENQVIAPPAHARGVLEFFGHGQKE